MSMKLGCQARSLGKGVYPNESDFLNAVRRVGELGFSGLETNWKNLERYFERPRVFKAELAAAGLELIGAHYGGPLADPSTRDGMVADIERVSPFVASVGGRFIVCSGARPEGRPLPDDTWPGMADRLHEFAEIARPNDVRVCYHNHWWECEEDGLGTLAKLTDPAEVDFAFDTGHHTRAGRDASEGVRLLGSRLAIVHLADYGEQAPDAAHRPPLGEGELDLEAAKAALGEVGFDGWLVLEETTEEATACEQVARCLPLMRRFIE